MKKKRIITEEIDWIKDDQSVTKDGERISKLIHGVSVRNLKSIEDKRGDVTEMYDLNWDVHPESMVYAYQVTIKPNAIRGWELHERQDDRIFISRGRMRWAAYDTRPDSPTYKLVNDFVFSELNRVLMIVPKGVLHAVKNIGTEDAIFINFPTTPYNHSDPDKIRPVDGSKIPFSFDDGEGW